MAAWTKIPVKKLTETESERPVSYTHLDVYKRQEYGRLLSFLYAEMRSLIPFCHERQEEEILIRLELFLQVYSAFAVSYTHLRNRGSYCGRTGSHDEVYP